MKGAMPVKIPKRKTNKNRCPNCGSEDLANRSTGIKATRIFGGKKGHHGGMSKMCMRCGFKVAMP